MPFLERTIEQNPGLVRSAVQLHQAGVLPPNSFVYDVDMFERNATAIKDEADRVGLGVYFMTKQHGRNPVVFQRVTADGRAKTVSVDLQCAQALHSNSIPIGHVGHVVQIPNSDVPHVVAAMRPEVVTVFSTAKATAVSDAALAVDRVQDVLLRVCGDGDVVFPGVCGGFHLRDLEATVRSLRGLPGVRIVGVTTFPALGYSDGHEPELTPNFGNLLRAASQLEGLGIEVNQINAPGNTAHHVLATLAEHGATHVEPGSALSAHTAFHLFDGGLAEQAAAVYVTEISHFLDGQAWVYGGGFFLDDPPVPELAGFAKSREALVGADPDAIFDRRVRFGGTGVSSTGSFGTIDYHGLLEIGPSSAAVGDTVVFGFRTQAFMTRANTAAVSGRGLEQPEMLGLYDVQGHRAPTAGHESYPATSGMAIDAAS